MNTDFNSSKIGRQMQDADTQAEAFAIVPLARLQREGYVTSEPYRSIFLTDKGKTLANAARERHDLVYRFLRCIGVSEETAKIDSEGVEHHVSKETLDAFQKIIRQREADL